MFEPSPHPRLFGLPPGVDFPRTLLDGLRARVDPADPTALARVDLIVNTTRMQRRMLELFQNGPPSLLPRIHLVTGLDSLLRNAPPPPSIPPLRRRLELVQLVAKLLEQQRDIGARSALYDLTDSLATLIEEMQGEGVPVSAVTGLDVSDTSGHWERAQSFIRIADQYLDLNPGQLDGQARHRRVVTQLIGEWTEAPPTHPIIIAGSTGSRGTVQMLMQATAKLPNGAVILPGFDFDMPTEIWSNLSDGLLSEDHPQYRFQDLAGSLNMHAAQVKPWTDAPPPDPQRNRVLSLALRPAPVTDAWLIEGSTLGDVSGALDGVTLVNADGPRAEALAIALRLRQAAEDGQTAALITLDRMLSRQVTAALDRWDIIPDDSAGMPLHLSPPGRLLRHIAQLFRKPLDAELLLTLLKHPLTHSTETRNQHQLNTQRLELQMRKDGLPYPKQGSLVALATRAMSDDAAQSELQAWANWVGETLCGLDNAGERPLTEWVAQHRDTAEALARGMAGGGTGQLWEKQAGVKALGILTGLAEEAAFSGDMSAADYADLIGALLAQGEVRDRDAPHPKIMIWGTLEARVQGADLVILGGMNEGTWPEAPKPDPWLNRVMRHQAGLLLPERRIGLSAHDFQQAVAAPEVWITRAIRSDEAETVPSRWINRVQNLLNGLPSQGGEDAWNAAVARGATWLEQAQALEEITPVAPAPRPAPKPPVSARPRKLYVTEIQKLIRDPYAIYAKHCLRLKPLGPIVQDADARLRGTVFHSVMEAFLKRSLGDPDALSVAGLRETTRAVLENQVPWPTTRALWQARIERIAPWFVKQELERRKISQPVAFEDNARGALNLADIGMEIGCFADRIDLDDRGCVRLYDYKTGSPPTKKEQKTFDKQLLIEAAMMEEGAFANLGPRSVENAVYIGLGSNPVEMRAPLDEDPPAKTLTDLRALLLAYLDPNKGYLARRAPHREDREEDYDHLARYGEWNTGTSPTEQEVT